MAIIEASQLPRRFYGLSSDTKPENLVPAESTFFETDTKAWFIYSGTEWVAL